jgi:hypothetical protein
MSDLDHYYSRHESALKRPVARTSSANRLTAGFSWLLGRPGGSAYHARLSHSTRPLTQTTSCRPCASFPITTR